MFTLEAKPTLAARAAADHLRSNLRALSQVQPSVSITTDDAPRGMEWVFGRDGSLTARDSLGHWYGGCSLPARAAEQMLEKLDVRGSVACFLAPTHAAQVRAALRHSRPEQALIVLLPQQRDLEMLLACENFRPDIEAHRLWLVAGDGWPAQLAHLFDTEPGLATPAQFIRVPASDAQLVEQLVSQAQDVLSQVTQQRMQKLANFRALPWRAPAVRRLCVVAGSRFRLWNDLGDCLGSAARELAEAHDCAWTMFDADDPLCGSPLGLALVARQCSAVLSANTARCDLPGVLPDEMPWITWVSGSRIPSFTEAGQDDHLVLADERAAGAARTAGWPEARVHAGGWRPLIGPGDGELQDRERRAHLAVIADTCPLEPPDTLNEYSSHTVLWQTIREELSRDIFTLDGDVQTFLRRRMGRFGISESGFPFDLFVNRLIVPAYQQGIARTLIEGQVPLRLFGEGWADLPELARHAAGAVASRAQLERALEQARAVVHVWPTRQAHPVQTCGVPVVQAFGQSRAAFLAAARNGGNSTNPSGPRLSGKLLARILLRFPG